MDDDVTVVEKNPRPLIVTATGAAVTSSECVVYGLDDGAALHAVRAGANDKVVGYQRQAAQVEGHDVLSAFVVGNVGGVPRALEG